MAVPVVTWEQYAADWSGLHGGLDLRRARPGVQRWMRVGFVVARSLQRARVPAGAVTALGLLCSVTVVVVVGHGSSGILLAAILVAAAALADTVDGALAVLSGHTTRLGYVYDAVVDRVGEALWLIALWRIGAAGHVATAAGALAWLHEYVRSRANAAGMTEITAVTVGERPTRVMLTIGGLVLAGLADTFNPHVAAGIAAVTTAAWIVFGLIGITQLLAAAHRALAGRSWPAFRRPGTPTATAPVSEAPQAPSAPAPTAAVRPSTPPPDAEPMSTSGRPEPGRGEPTPAGPLVTGPTSVGPLVTDPTPVERVVTAPTPVEPVVTGDAADAGYRRGDGNAAVDPNARERGAYENGISEVVSYASPSADEPSEPSEPSRGIALGEPTLDDLLGDVGVRVRDAVGKYGRSVTVYRSRAATDLANAADDGDAIADAAASEEVDDAPAGDDEDSARPTGGDLQTPGGNASPAGGDASTDLSAPDAATYPTGPIPAGNPSSPIPAGDTSGSTAAGDPSSPIPAGDTSGGATAATDPTGPTDPTAPAAPAGRSRSAGLTGLNRARIRLARRPRTDTTKTGTEDAGTGQGGGASSGSDRTAD